MKEEKVLNLAPLGHIKEKCFHQSDEHTEKLLNLKRFLGHPRSPQITEDHPKNVARSLRRYMPKSGPESLRPLCLWQSLSNIFHQNQITIYGLIWEDPGSIWGSYWVIRGRSWVICGRFLVILGCSGVIWCEGKHFFRVFI